VVDPLGCGRSPRCEQVVSQAERRVLRGESVPASDKILSIFEPHTDIIIKDNREPICGHKVCLTSGASGLITDVMVLDGNPADSTLAVPAIQRQTEILGKAPKQAAFDGGFASRKHRGFARAKLALPRSRAKRRSPRRNQGARRRRRRLQQARRARDHGHGQV
jgi:transposase, IS5 family